MSNRTTRGLLSASAVARRLDVPNMTFFRAIQRGVVSPEFRSGAEFLFTEESIPGIAAALRQITPRPSRINPPTVQA